MLPRRAPYVVYCVELFIRLRCVNFAPNCIAHNTLAFDIVAIPSLPFGRRIDMAFKATGKPVRVSLEPYYYCRLTYG